MPKATHVLLSLFIATTILLAACTPAEVAPPVAADPTPTADEPAPTATPEPEPTPEPTPEPEPTLEPTPTEDPEGPPPTEADLSLYTEAEDREAYLVIDLTDTAVQPFQDEYIAALAENAAWLQDPYAVATQFIDTTRRFTDEPFPYEESFYLPAPAGEAIIIVILGDYKDDSVWGHKIRIELSLQEAVWAVDWVGEQWRCRRGDADLIENWHTTLCP